MKHNRSNSHLWTIAVGALILSAFFTVLAARSADAAPYGGCDEAYRYPTSDGADWCRRHGWTVTGSLVVSPHSVVMASRIPHCRYEDGSGQRERCLWDASVDGVNGRGDSFIERRGDVRYVWMNSPTGHGWKWVDEEWAFTLDIVLGRHNWSSCVVLDTKHRDWIDCAGPTDYSIRGLK